MNSNLAAMDPPSAARLLEQSSTLEQVANTFKIPVEAILMTAERLFAKRLESTAELGREEAEALFRARGLQQAERLIQESGESLNSEEVAARLGITRQAVNERKKRGTLLAFAPAVGRGDRFPLWQFRGKMVRPWVPPIVRQIGNGFDALAFLLARRKSRDGHRYLDLALSDDETVIREMLARATSTGQFT